MGRVVQFGMDREENEVGRKTGEGPQSTTVVLSGESPYLDRCQGNGGQVLVWIEEGAALEAMEVSAPSLAPSQKTRSKEGDSGIGVREERAFDKLPNHPAGD